MCNINYLRGVVPALKRMLCGRHLPLHLAMAMVMAVAMGATSCNEDEDLGQATDGPPNRRVEVELAYSLGEGLGDIADVVIMYPITHFEDSAVCDTLSSGQTWTKTLTYDTPATVGMIVSPLREADATPASAITVQYEYSCTVRLMEGNSVVDIKEHSSSEELTMSYETDSLLAEQLAAALYFHTLFSVDDNGITEIDRTIDDSDQAEADELPEEDEENVTMANPLYYVSPVDLATDHQFLHDNMVARFSNRQQYTAGYVLSKGEFLFLKGSEANSVDKEALRASAANGAIFILDEIDSYQTLADFYTTIEAHNFLQEDADVAGELFIIADAAVNLSYNDSSPYSRFFYRLSPRDNEGNHVSDYVQGQIIDQALTSIQKALYGTGTSTNFLNVSTRSTDDELQEVTDLVAATIWYENVLHTLPASYYVNASKAKKTSGATNNYSVEHDIWNVYDVEKKENYYLIHQEIMSSFKNGYANIYNANDPTIAKVCEWYGSCVIVELSPTNSSTMHIHRSTPETTTTSTSYTSGFSWNLSGEIGYSSGSAAAKLSGGVSFNKSTTYTVDDVTISNLCAQNQLISWEFDLQGPTANFNLFMTSCTNMHEPAECAKSTFTAGTDCIISIPDIGEAPKLYFFTRTEVRSAEGMFGTLINNGLDFGQYTHTYTLPFLQESDFTD